MHNKAELEETIYDFVERHDRQKLRKHASKGNINGMENFLDIFTSLIRLLYLYLKMGVVNRYRFIGLLCNLLEVATSGIESEQDYSDGYLLTLHQNLGGNSQYLQEVCKEQNFLGHLYAALVIVQKIRLACGEQSKKGAPPGQPLDTLSHFKNKLRNAILTAGVEWPTENDVIKALGEYRVFTQKEVGEYISQLDI